MNKKEFANWILQMLKEHPKCWQWDRHTVTFRNPDRKDSQPLEIWISNRPYKDLVVETPKCSPRIGNWWQRRKIRKAMDALHRQRLVDYHTPKSSGEIKQLEALYKKGS